MSLSQIPESTGEKKQSPAENSQAREKQGEVQVVIIICESLPGSLGNMGVALLAANYL